MGDCCIRKKQAAGTLEMSNADSRASFSSERLEANFSLKTDAHFDILVWHFINFALFLMMPVVKRQINEFFGLLLKNENK